MTKQTLELLLAMLNSQTVSVGGDIGEIEAVLAARRELEAALETSPQQGQDNPDTPTHTGVEGASSHAQ